MSNWLDRLVNFGNYTELEVQESIEHFWPCLFHQYALCTHLKCDIMPGDWQPDILAAETVSDFGSVLIVEIKGSPPSSSLSDSVGQVVSYAQRYHEQYPGGDVRLAVIGPWRVAREGMRIKRAGYSITGLSLRRIGEQLSEMADNLLAWMCQAPASSGSPLIPIEDSILKLDAVTDPAERPVASELIAGGK